MEDDNTLISRVTASSAVALLLLAVIFTNASFSSPPSIRAYASASPSELYIADASLSPRTLKDTNKYPATALVDFHHTFSSIDSVCFVFKFRNNNLLDPGEELEITTYFGGFLNGGSYPQTERTICFDPQLHPEVTGFLDGRENFEIRMWTGSVNIKSLTVQITGLASS